MSNFTTRTAFPNPSLLQASEDSADATILRQVNDELQVKLRLGYLLLLGTCFSSLRLLASLLLGYLLLLG
jgi:hypothetical protein